MNIKFRRKGFLIFLLGMIFGSCLIVFLLFKIDLLNLGLEENNFDKNVNSIVFNCKDVSLPQLLKISEEKIRRDGRIDDFRIINLGNETNFFTTIIKEFSEELTPKEIIAFLSYVSASEPFFNHDKHIVVLIPTNSIGTIKEPFSVKGYILGPPIEILEENNRCKQD